MEYSAGFMSTYRFIKPINFRIRWNGNDNRNDPSYPTLARQMGTIDTPPEYFSTFVRDPIACFTVR